MAAVAVISHSGALPLTGTKGFEVTTIRRAVIELQTTRECLRNVRITSAAVDVVCVLRLAITRGFQS